MSKLIFKVGINDADYKVTPTLNGKRSICPYYQKWKAMLRRCYDLKFIVKNPAYLSCTVHSEWLTFSSFKSWMQKQDWEGKDLDKDILFQGNKHYSPDTCIFISSRINLLLVSCNKNRGNYPLGVNYHKQSKKFRARCRHHELNKQILIGVYDCPLEAHKAYLTYKYALIKTIAYTQTEPLKSALLAYTL